MAGVHKRCRGAYAVVAMITGYGIVGFRDPNGIRPVVYGKRVHPDGEVDYMIASESVALNSLGFELVGDIAPGEAIYITNEGELHTRQCAESPSLTLCIFEHVHWHGPTGY